MRRVSPLLDDEMNCTFLHFFLPSQVDHHCLDKTFSVLRPKPLNNIALSKSVQFFLFFSFFYQGHHEIPPEAHKKILEKFPDSLPRNPGNVIPPAADNKAEEVGRFCFVCFGELISYVWLRIFLTLLAVSRCRR